MLVEILLIVPMIIVCFILYKLATMSPLGWHPPHAVWGGCLIEGGGRILLRPHRLLILAT